ncbi:MAG: cytochrome P450 [Gammaproteobacteria bacterium]
MQLPPKAQYSLITALFNKQFAISSMVEKYGDIFSLNFFGNKIVVLSHPDFAYHILHEQRANYIKPRQIVAAAARLKNKEGLFQTNNMDWWRAHRSTVNQLLDKQAVEKYADSIVNNVTESIKKWQSNVNLKKPFSLIDTTDSLTFNNLLTTLFHVENIDKQALLNCILSGMVEFATLRVEKWIDIAGWFNGKWLKIKRDIDRLDKYSKQLVQDYLNARNPEQVLLQGLAQANSNHSVEFIQQRLIEETKTFLITGHHTISASLAWLILTLAKQPEICQKMHNELTEVLQGRPITVRDFTRLPYLDSVIKETLRFYPPVQSIAREPVENDVIAGYKINKGLFVIVSVQDIHHHPDFWDNPEAFYPERFLKKPAANHEYAYIPFGLGPRSCPGSHFSYLELTLLVATIFQQYYFKLPRPLLNREDKSMIARPSSVIQVLPCMW